MQPQLSNYKKMLQHEKKTVGFMVEIYCKEYHKTRNELCIECTEFKKNVFFHLEKCPIQEKKSACGRCLLCYPADYKERLFEVMGSAGPKMFLYHPILSLRHLWDARIEPDSAVKVSVL